MTRTLITMTLGSIFLSACNMSPPAARADTPAASPAAPAQAVPTTFQSANDLVGDYSVTFVTTLSTCEKTRAGDTDTHGWNIKVKDGKLKVVPTEKGHVGYEGVVASAGRAVLNNETSAAMELTGSANKLAGRRVKAFHTPTATDPALVCVVMEEVTATRK